MILGKIIRQYQYGTLASQNYQLVCRKIDITIIEGLHTNFISKGWNSIRITEIWN